jgi:hypothetical protein
VLIEVTHGALQFIRDGIHRDRQLEGACLQARSNRLLERNRIEVDRRTQGGRLRPGGSRGSP